MEETKILMDFRGELLRIRPNEASFLLSWLANAHPETYMMAQESYNRSMKNSAEST